MNVGRKKLVNEVFLNVNELKTWVNGHFNKSW